MYITIESHEEALEVALDIIESIDADALSDMNIEKDRLLFVLNDLAGTLEA